jgi:hypothetical protein
MLAAAALNEWLKYYGCAKGLELRSAECEYDWLNPFEFILALVRDSTARWSPLGGILGFNGRTKLLLWSVQPQASDTNHSFCLGTMMVL